jgi:hypothetical protein
MIMHLKPILNTSLPQQFRQIRLELAREPGHPEGDSGIGYIVIARSSPMAASITSHGKSIVRHVA